jgi:anthranilate phosphoribosyltransferase
MVETPVKQAITKLVLGNNLTNYEADAAMEEIMSGTATPSQIAAFLTAIRMKGVTIDELAAFASSMKRHAISIKPKGISRLVDTCGTGGDTLKTFNISTVCALISAGAGVKVAKHGNRSSTSKCGSADLLEKLGVNIMADPATVEASIERANIGFMFAPIFHPAMKHASTTRKEIGIRTVFNVLGPLTNPAGAAAQVVGVYEDELVIPVASVLKKLGVEDALVVHGLDGIDEISLVGRTHAARIKSGRDDISEELLEPASFGLERRSFQEISAEGADIDLYASTAFNVLSLGDSELSAKERATKEMMLMNSAAALVVAGKASTYQDGTELARESVDTGRALEKLIALVRCTNGDLGRIEMLSKKRPSKIKGLLEP